MSKPKWTGKVGSYEGRPVRIIWANAGDLILRYLDGDRVDAPLGERVCIWKRDPGLTLTEIIDVAPAAPELEV
jgi:hypothetical protein